MRQEAAEAAAIHVNSIHILERFSPLALGEGPGVRRNEILAEREYPAYFNCINFIEKKFFNPFTDEKNPDRPGISA
jgi:hypothetical protein